MIRVGVTGGLGAGKSTLCELLGERGSRVLSADDIAKEMIAPGGPAYGPVSRRFPDTLRADQSIDTARLAAKVFTDARSLAWLNGLVHPLVAHRLEEMFAELERAGEEVVCVEVPLLAEAGFERQFDLVVHVRAPMEARLARLTEAGWKEIDARRRIAVQCSDEERDKVAHIVVDNDGTKRKLRAAADSLWERVTQGEFVSSA